MGCGDKRMICIRAEAKVDMLVVQVSTYAVLESVLAVLGSMEAVLRYLLAAQGPGDRRSS